MPLISVIVPVYKVEPYLHQCVDSILNQTFKDFELILVDDGSPDNCPAICDEYAKKDNRVIVIHKENGGLSSARNAGLDYVFANSNSEYISFVDSDDYVSSIFLEMLLYKIENNDLIVCYYNFLSLVSREVIIFKPVECIVNEIGYWNYKDEGIFRVVAWNKLYKRDIFKNIRYPIGKIQEDQFIIHEIIGLCSSIAITADRLYYYRLREDSIMGKIIAAEGKSNEIDRIALDILVTRALYYYKRNNDFLNYYKQSFNMCIFLYIHNHFFDKELYGRLKKIYILKSENNEEISKAEKLFFAWPFLYRVCLFVKNIYAKKRV